MNMNLKAKRVVVIENNGADEIIFDFENIDNGAYPFDGCQPFRAQIAQGTSKKWLRANFGREILNITETINTRAI